jgi:nucleoside 2-deoxyribosyltransferase
MGTKKKKSRLQGLRVYLAGTMEYSKDGGSGWRRVITPALKKLGLIVMDPTNRPLRLSFASSSSEEIDNLKKLRNEGNFDTLVTYAKEIVHQDLRMVDVADLVIVFINATVPTVGTIDEFVTACTQKKPVLLFCEQGKKGLPIWFWGRIGRSHSKVICDDLNEVVERLKQIAYCNDEHLDEFIDNSKWVFLHL